MLAGLEAHAFDESIELLLVGVVDIFYVAVAPDDLFVRFRY